MSTMKELHTQLIDEAFAAGVTIIDLARAQASIDRVLDKFDAGAMSDNIEVGDSHFIGYVCETEEQLRRAIKYAKERK